MGYALGFDAADPSPQAWMELLDSRVFRADDLDVMGSYVNFPNPSLGDAEYASAYWGTGYVRLQAVKQAYDPTDYFHMPAQNVRLPSEPELPVWEVALLSSVAAGALIAVIVSVSVCCRNRIRENAERRLRGQSERAARGVYSEIDGAMTSESASDRAVLAAQYQTM